MSGPVWGLLHLFLPTCDLSDPEPRVIHEARGRSQDGSVQEAVEGEETDPGGVHPAVAASSAAHPPHKREYANTLLQTETSQSDTARLLHVPQLFVLLFIHFIIYAAY